MAEVIVDREKLADGLKRGIGYTDTIFADGPYEYRLRYTACGLVSSAIHQYCLVQDIPSRLMISSPNLAIDPDMQHVIPVVGETVEQGRVIDASFSQFLGYVGLNWGYEEDTGHKAFPSEEIIDFNFMEHEVIASWLADLAAAFTPVRIREPAVYEDYILYRFGEGPLSSADKEAINQVYSAIWNPANMQVWHPSQRIVNDGQVVASQMAHGSIILD